MSRVGYCTRCGTPSLVGAISTGEEICARCASVQFDAPEEVVAKELLLKCPLDAKDIVVQIEELKRR